MFQLHIHYIHHRHLRFFQLDKSRFHLWFYMLPTRSTSIFCNQEIRNSQMGNYGIAYHCSMFYIDIDLQYFGKFLLYFLECRNSKVLGRRENQSILKKPHNILHLLHFIPKDNNSNYKIQPDSKHSLHLSIQIRTFL